jgi:hypothetical protein
MGDLSFTAFVVSLASSAAIHFGDLPDPSTGERAELNLEGAAQMIDILSPSKRNTWQPDNRGTAGARTDPLRAQVALRRGLGRRKADY